MNRHIEHKARRALINALKEPLNPVGIRIEALADRILDALEQNGLTITLAPRDVGEPVDIVGRHFNPTPDEE